MFSTYAGDEAVTKYLGWPRHRSIEDSRAFLEFSEAEWERHPAAGQLGLCRLYALCHPEHAISRRVLEKCGFTREGILTRHSELPNLEPGRPSDVVCYAKVFD